MKKLILLLLLLAAQPILAAYAYVAGGDWADGSSGTSMTYSGQTLATGETVFITVTYGSPTRIVETFSDGTNTYAYVGTALDATNGQALAYFVCKNATGGTYTFTFGLASSANSRGLSFRRYTGLDAAGTPQFVGQNVNNVATSNDAITSGNVTPSAQPGILFASTLETSGSGATPSAGTGFTTRGAYTNWDTYISKSMSEDKPISSLSAVAGTMTSSSATNSYVIGAIFYPETGASGGGGSSAAGRALLLGVGK